MDAIRGLRIVRDQMRLRGWQVVEVGQWWNNGRGDVIVPRGAVNHWTAGPRTGNAPSLRVVTHGREGLRNALCHTYSDRAATLYLIAARVAWHAGAGSWPGLRGNLDCLGHEPECSGPGDWRPGQLELQADLDVIQADVFGYPLSNVIDHFEWAGNRKQDRTDVGGAPWRRRLVATRHQPPPAPSEEDDVIVTIEGSRTAYHVVGSALYPLRVEHAEVLGGPDWRRGVKTLTEQQALAFEVMTIDTPGVLRRLGELLGGKRRVTSPQGAVLGGLNAFRWANDKMGAGLDTTGPYQPGQ